MKSGPPRSRLETGSSTLAGGGARDRPSRSPVRRRAIVDVERRAPDAGRRHAEIGQLLVRKADRAAQARDLRLERLPAPAASEEAEPGQLPLGFRERPLCVGARFCGRQALLLDQPLAHPLLGTQPLLLDLCLGLVQVARRERSLVDGEPLNRRLLERLREARHRVAIVEIVEVALALAHVAGDVEARRLPGAGESDVAPLLQPGFARAEHERALDGDALAGVAGERVGVADVPRLEVAAAECDAVAAVGEDGERAVLPPNRLHRAAGAVLDAKRVRVTQADDAVAGGELSTAGDEPLPSEAFVRLHQRPGERVQLRDVATAERDHYIAGEGVACSGPPVGEQPRAGGERTLRDDEPLALLGEGEVVAAEPAPDGGERFPLEGIVLAAVVAQLDGAVALDEAGEEAAGADGGELLRVADQHDLAARLLDPL